jgi:hypothetical protein
MNYFWFEAHSDQSSRTATDNSVRRNVLRHDSAHANDRSVAN